MKTNLGVFQSGQMGQTVNLLAMPSVVRIHPRPQNFPFAPRSRQGFRAEVLNAEVAQLIEHQPSKLRVASLSLVFRSSIEVLPPTPEARFRNICQCSSVVEHFLGKEEVTGSNPVIGSVNTR